MHSEYTGTPEMFEATKELLDKTGLPFYSHLSETSQEVEYFLSRRNVRPMKFFDELKFFNQGGAMVHGVYLSDDDIYIIKKRNVSSYRLTKASLKRSSFYSSV